MSEKDKKLKTTKTTWKTSIYRRKRYYSLLTPR